MKNICLIQARLGSTRFHEKILQPIQNNLTAIDLLNIRIKRSAKIDEIIFSIPDQEADDKLSNFLTKRGINFKRGECFDLIDRYKKTLCDFEECNIIRITSDCPLVDPHWIDLAIRLFNKEKLSYCSSYTPANSSKFCNGSDIEIFSKKTLLELDKIFKDKKDREHVTFPLWDGRMNLKSMNLNKFIEDDISDVRITLDYPNDLVVLKKIGEKLDLCKASLSEIVGIYRELNLKKINGMYSYNDGWV